MQRIARRPFVLADLKIVFCRAFCHSTPADGTAPASIRGVARNRPGDLDDGDATVNDRLPSADDDSLPLAAQARQQGGRYGLFLFGLMLLLGVAVLVVLVLGSGHLAGT
jgi:hypothetical protein